MKKIVCVIFGITMVLSLLNVFIELNNRLSLEFLFHKNQHSIEIDLDPFENPDLNFREIVDHLLRFSEENDVVILNYVLLGETEINIYTSNFPDYSRIQLLEGNYPEGSQFLSNRKLGLDRSFQSGQIAFPFSNWNIRIYQMEQVANVGFGSRTVFHLLDASDEVAHLFMEEFSIYNETFLSESWQADFLREGLGFHLTNGQSESWLDVLSAPLGTALFFSYLTLFLAVILYLMKQRQRFLLEDLWGYSQAHSFLSLPKQFVSVFALMIFALGALIAAVLFINQQQSFLNYYVIYFLINVSYPILIFLPFLYAGMLFMRKNHQIALALKGKNFFERLQWGSFSVKVVLLTFLFVALSGFFNALGQLNAELGQMIYWQQAQNVFRVGGISVGFDNHFSGSLTPEEFFEWYEERGGNPYEFAALLEEEGTSLEEYLEMASFIVDYDTMRGQDETLTKLFLAMEQELHAFILDASAFSRFDADSQEEAEDGFLYEWFPGATELEAATRRNITISYRYLELNEILDENASNVLDALVHDSLTLNVLVPSHYRHLEAELRAHYLEQFYFEKVFLENNFRPQVNLPLLELERSDLEVNLIFTASNQSYFSYSRMMGNAQSMMMDPIAIIHNLAISPAQTAARVTSALYFKHDGRDGALDALQPILNELGAVQVNYVYSVFSQGNEDLIHLQWMLFQQTLNMVMNVAFSLILCAVLIWAFYQGNAYKINLHYLFGYTFWERNKALMAMVLLANILGTALFAIVAGLNPMALVFFAAISLVDVAMIKILGNSLTRKNVVKILKGGELT